MPNLQSKLKVSASHVAWEPLVRIVCYVEQPAGVRSQRFRTLSSFGISDLEHHFHEHGSPLNAAVQNHRWEAVKFLILHGATVPKDLWRPKNSIPSTANPDFIIREWLFVGRHTERKRVSLGLWNNELKIKSWSGV